MAFLYGCFILWPLLLPLPVLLSAQPDWEETPKPLPCQKISLYISCKGRGFSTFPQGLGYGIKRIDVSHNAILNLTESDTATLEHLEQLDLGSNRLQWVSERALKHLVRLHSLILATNHLHRDYNSNAKAFLALVSLVALDLSANNLDNDMVALYLHSLPSLERLDLSRNHVTRLSESIFQGMPKLREINMKSNYIAEIEEGAFTLLSGLEVLNLAMNSLPCISGFSLTQLRILNLSYNMLEFFEVAEGGLASGEAPYQLQALDLSHNRLVLLPLLPRRNQLGHLNVSHNTIALLAASSTRTELYSPGHYRRPWDMSSANLRLRKVTDLDLSNNHLESFPVRFLYSLNSLQSLSMGMNCLQDITVELPTNCSFQSPDANRRQPGVGVRQDLISLSVRKLDLQGNAIHYLPQCFFDIMPDLEAVDMSLNNIQLCRAWNVSKRERPSAERENCTSFQRIPRLRHLSLRGNNLGTVHSHQFSHTPLSSLDLSENKGLSMPGAALEGLESSLQELSLRGSQMKISGLNFPCLGVLKRLDLSENKLSLLPRSLHCAPLEKLNIRANRLPSLEEATVMHLARSLQSMSVAGNPFSCCELQWLDVLGASAITVPDLDETLCYYRDRGKNFTARISDKDAVHLCPPEAPRASLAVLMACLCSLCLPCSICYFVKKGKKHMPLYLGFLSNKVDPAPYLSKETSGQTATDNITKV
ncbi:transforming growth factor beta activator LRRC32-like [Rhineura floridana]|uniref:transforming growth factor beta activator LRRC32-like n=1 Tax=Rhineura floridana TaxID=261503 RepID=UPI002AC84EA6|nr:transforming growth factor beta activator LRRC32-like [Rhineura floridana]